MRNKGAKGREDRQRRWQRYRVEIIFKQSRLKGDTIAFSLNDWRIKHIFKSKLGREKRDLTAIRPNWVRKSGKAEAAVGNPKRLQIAIIKTLFVQRIENKSRPRDKRRRRPMHAKVAVSLNSMLHCAKIVHSYVFNSQFLKLRLMRIQRLKDYLLRTKNSNFHPDSSAFTIKHLLKRSNDIISCISSGVKTNNMVKWG